MLFCCKASIKSNTLNPVLLSSIVKAVNQRFDFESGNSGWKSKPSILPNLHYTYRIFHGDVEYADLILPFVLFQYQQKYYLNDNYTPAHYVDNEVPYLSLV